MYGCFLVPHTKATLQLLLVESSLTSGYTVKVLQMKNNKSEQEKRADVEIARVLYTKQKLKSLQISRAMHPFCSKSNG